MTGVPGGSPGSTTQTLAERSKLESIQASASTTAGASLLAGGTAAASSSAAAPSADKPEAASGMPCVYGSEMRQYRTTNRVCMYVNAGEPTKAETDAYQLQNTAFDTMEREFHEVCRCPDRSAD